MYLYVVHTDQVANVQTDRQVGSNHRQGSSPQQVGPLPTTTSCPQTPRCKRVKSEWHGLPSPDTPASFTELITWNFAARGNDNEFDQSKAPSDDPLNIECTPLRPSVSPLTSRSSSVYTSGEVTGSLDNVHTAMTVSIESNTKRAPELETSLCPSTRRSARIRSKTKSTGKLISHREGFRRISNVRKNPNLVFHPAN